MFWTYQSVTKALQQSFFVYVKYPHFNFDRIAYRDFLDTISLNEPTTSMVNYGTLQKRMLNWKTSVYKGKTRKTSIVIFQYRIIYQNYVITPSNSNTNKFFAILNFFILFPHPLVLTTSGTENTINETRLSQSRTVLDLPPHVQGREKTSLPEIVKCTLSGLRYIIYMAMTLT